MRNKYIWIVLSIAVAMIVVVVAAFAGNPDGPPGPPESTYSYTLEHIYQRLDTGAAGTPITFTEPISGPGTGTMHTLDEIMGVAPEVDDTNGATQAQVLEDRTFWGLSSGEWGVMTGTMPDNDAVTMVPGTTNQYIDAGYHNGAGYVEGDADLVADNVRSGVNIFGVDGDPSVVDTGSGTATAADILSGKVAWVDGSEVTGNRAPAPVPKTGQTISYTVGDDGDLEMGVAWITSTRFITGTTGSTGVTVVVTDTLTELVWLQDANCIANQYPGFDNDATSGDGQVTWQHALDFVAGITVTGSYSSCAAGFSDWRLPNVQELLSLIDYGEVGPALPDGHPFTGVEPDFYWSGTTFANNTSVAWRVGLGYGGVPSAGKTSVYYVWPVRGGQ